MIKIKLKTNFWKETNPEKWVEKYNKTNDINLMLSIAILAGLTLKTPLLIGIPAGAITIIGIMTTITHNKHKKEKRENDENTNTKT